MLTLTTVNLPFIINKEKVKDEKLKEQEEKKIKAEKRKELIARLTDEEKELLGIE